MDPESELSTPASSPYKLSEEICGKDDFLVSTRIPCLDHSAVPEAVPLPSPSDSLSKEDEGIIPGPWDVSVAHKPCVRSYLDRYISDGVVILSERVDEDEGLNTSGQDYPPRSLKKVLTLIIPTPNFSKYMERNFKHVGTKFWILDSFFVVHAKHTEMVLTASVGCMLVYQQSM